MTDRNSQDPLPLDEFDYHLPRELIAQQPVEPRDASRLLVVERSSGHLEDRRFRDLPEILNAGDLLIVNDTRVRHARLSGRRQSGGAVELLVLHRDADESWQCLARPARRLKSGEELELLTRAGDSTGRSVRVLDKSEGTVRVEGLDEAVIEEFGSVPLPPYIDAALDDPARYQTVYRNEYGSAAAPTAGLHFTSELIERCRDAGVEISYVTLHVGLDTFRPVTVADARQHKIHSEWCRVPAETWERVAETKRSGNRVVAVGTTAVRSLESAARSEQACDGFAGWTDLYITPPFEFMAVDAIITNFHLPRSTLLLLVGAFMGGELMWTAYRRAIAQRYRFYSFGDAMLIL